MQQIKKIKSDEYFLLTDLLDSYKYQIKGECEDIDCDKWIFRKEMKKFKPVLEHGFSCLPSLKRNRDAVISMVNLKRYRKFRIKKCEFCKKPLDTLNERNKLLSYTSIEPNGKFGGYQWLGFHVHPKCAKKFVTPKGFKKGF